MTLERSFEELCRLCGSRSGIHVNIFCSLPECLSKIEAVIPDVVILRHDSLPKHICHRCLSKVREFYEFRSTCIQTQEELRKRLPWMSHPKGISQPASPIVTFMGGPLAHPFGDPEPVVEVLTLSDDDDSQADSSSTYSALKSATSKCESSLGSGLPPHHPTAGVSAGFSGTGSTGIVTQIVSELDSRGNDTSQTFRQSFGGLPPMPQGIPITQPQTVSKMTPKRHVVAKSSPRPASAKQQPVQAHSGNFMPNLSTLFHPDYKRTCLQPSNGSNNCSDTKNAENRGLVTKVSSPSNLKKILEYPSEGSVGSTVNHVHSSNHTSALPCPTSTEVSLKKSQTRPPLKSGGPIQMREAPRSYNENTIRSHNECASDSLSSPDDTENFLRNLGLGSSISVSTIDAQRNGVSEGIASCVSISSAKSEKTKKVIPSRQKPRPKCKKRPLEVELTEADVPRICERYPTVDPVKICGSKIVLTCRLCNIIMVHEEALARHNCSAQSESSSSNNTLKKMSDGGECSQNDDPNPLSSCSVELILSDDENSECGQTPKHMCGVCFKVFHNISRLQKHQASDCVK